MFEQNYKEEIDLIKEGKFEEAFEPIEDGDMTLLDVYFDIVQTECKLIKPNCNEDCKFLRFFKEYSDEYECDFLDDYLNDMDDDELFRCDLMFDYFLDYED